MTAPVSLRRRHPGTVEHPQAEIPQVDTLGLMNSVLSDDQLQELRQRLLQMQDELRQSLRERSAAAAPVELDQTTQGRLSRMDAMQGQAMAQAAVRRAEQQLVLIAQSLRHLDDEDFGACEDCGETIAYARLQRDPCHRLCVPCAQARELA